MDNLLNDIKTVEDRDLVLTRDDIPKTVKDKLKKLTVVHMTLAIKPTPGILDQIDTFFSTQVGRKVLIDWQVSEDILAGANIIYQGTYGNFSIAKQL